MKEALKLALDALENGDVPTPENAGKNLDAITAIKAALAQPAQEPVAWYVSNEGQPVTEPTFYREYAEQELAGQIEGCGSVLSELYTTPPQRTWVGLTEARAKEIWLKGKDHGDDWLDVLALARAFEAELKELNT